MKLFPADLVVGIFRGFSEGGLEFHADLVFPYRNTFQSTPMHGQFVLVQLEGENEAVLGRITSVSADGRLSSGPGEDFNIRAVSEGRQVPEDLREQYLKYRVNIRVLGVIRLVNNKVVFAPSHRRLPHVGSKVAFLADDILMEVTGHTLPGAELGYLAFGEFIYAAGDPRLRPDDWMQLKSPMIIPKFDVKGLVARRSFVFARAGFGKSNLTKLLFSGLYQATPTVERRGGGRAPVGTIIFDIDGEYFWPDVHQRPGLCDVPHLEDKIVLFTNKAAPSEFYGSFVAGGIRIHIRRFRPADVISIALSPEKQDQQNVRKLKGLSDDKWRELVDAIFAEKNSTDIDLVKRVLDLSESQEAEALAARANVTTIVNMLHDPSSLMLDSLLEALRAGKIAIIDVSQMRGQPALVLSGLILQRIFDINQEEFVKAQPNSIPTIAVIEEAQAVLSSANASNEGPYITWVKEGRKYDLGAFMITQQPGSISGEILSQGDNWFVFHLLSDADLNTLRRANAHYSPDLLSSLLNEPIPGHAVTWSSVSGKPYPISLRVLSFEGLYTMRDMGFSMPAGNTFASTLRQRQRTQLAKARADSGDLQETGKISTDSGQSTKPDEQAQDTLELMISAAIARLKDSEVVARIRGGQAVPWRALVSALEPYFESADPSDRNRLAYNTVPRALNEIFGENQWKSERRDSKSRQGTTVLYVSLVEAMR